MVVSSYLAKLKVLISPKQRINPVTALLDS